MVMEKKNKITTKSIYHHVLIRKNGNHIITILCTFVLITETEEEVFGLLSIWEEEITKRFKRI